MSDIQNTTSDTTRMSQGGKIIKGKEYTLDEMKEKGMLEL